jgi:transcriptional regulator with XRE-family HTH domain
MPAKKITRAERVCRALKAAQQLKGMTQDDVAKRMKVDRSTVSKWYRHVDTMSVGNFRLLCQVLSVVPQDILSID